MQTSQFNLSDLLTASGAAMGASNQRLRSAQAPALLSQFSLEVNFRAAFCLPPGDCTLLFGAVGQPNAQMAVVAPAATPNVSITATYIAAPSITNVPATPCTQPTPTQGGVCSP
ncbi:MAG: hypothetical protein ACM3XM_16635 [Mycobacterium leprae]